jgi:hypothetical protein
MRIKRHLLKRISAITLSVTLVGLLCSLIFFLMNDPLSEYFRINGVWTLGLIGSILWYVPISLFILISLLFKEPQSHREQLDQEIDMIEKQIKKDELLKKLDDIEK